MKIGFTGTRKGMTPKQFDTFCGELARLLRLGATEFHHGDCQGADAEAHGAASLVPRFCIIIHPPTNRMKRAFCGESRFAHVQWLKAKPYIDRNHDIVDSSDILIATPAEMTEQLRSGTWATVRYAEHTARKIVTIIYPDGTISIPSENIIP